MPAAWVDQVGQLSLEAANWVADVLGIVEQERITDREEAACYQRHRDAGIIR